MACARWCCRCLHSFGGMRVYARAPPRHAFDAAETYLGFPDAALGASYFAVPELTFDLRIVTFSAGVKID
ncbi:hypothetical protein EVAR_48997_1 [Eumeta japonica]|uniref:Uncharacterized protein n=1 Tax=Eumeta variegata TaxID=151549 RepID=A0A4C1YXB5_EUMVA|nr:hypothetical protein EVAR_48997_1 [Eumeta japonica]